MWEILALAWGCHGRWLAQVQVGTSELVSARTNPVALGGLQPGTNELIGEDLGVIIRLDADQ